MVSARGPGFLTTWQPQRNQISYTVVQGSKSECSSEGGGNVFDFYNLASEVMQSHFHCILLVIGESPRPVQIQGEGGVLRIFADMGLSGWCSQLSI